MAENVRLRAMRTFYTTREGLLTLDDDVLSIVSQVRDEYGDRVSIELDPETKEYLFIERCEDQTERLIFTSPTLDPLALDRLRRADAQSRAYEDPYDAAEREQDELDRLHDAAMREKFNEHGEHLAHALKKDGVMPRLPLTVSLYIPPERRTRA